MALPIPLPPPAGNYGDLAGELTHSLPPCRPPVSPRRRTTRRSRPPPRLRAGGAASSRVLAPPVHPQSSHAAPKTISETPAVVPSSETACPSTSAMRSAKPPNTHISPTSNMNASGGRTRRRGPLPNIRRLPAPSEGLAALLAVPAAVSHRHPFLRPPALGKYRPRKSRVSIRTPAAHRPLRGGYFRRSFAASFLSFRVPLS
jgi:hypothetical protein